MSAPGEILNILETKGFKNQDYLDAKKKFRDSLDMSYPHKESLWPKELYKLPYIQLETVDDETYLKYLKRHFRRIWSE